MRKLRSVSPEAAKPKARELASGEGWVVRDIVCGAGPNDRPFEEQHVETSVAIVVGGSFQYRTSTGRELMTPGSLLLGNAGDCFTCGHEHGIGDRCISFSYTREFCERFLGSAGESRFRTPRVAPVRALSPLVARVYAAMAAGDDDGFGQLSTEVLANAIGHEGGDRRRGAAPDASSLARVTRVVRMIDACPDEAHDLESLAGMARLSPYHFLRTFERVTGTTPHQYLLRTRLRRAATRVRTERAKIVEIALECGFGDVANFNRMFRAEFGVSPVVYRAG